ncbi:MAG: hypothetical protein JW717_01505 [Marinilabiliaceae bacterium]|nr:hypothetical protein [Marinilabiliaceae bacterium]
MCKKYVFFFLVLVSFCVCRVSKAQGYYKINGQVLVEEGNANDVLVLYYLNGYKQPTVNVENNGRFILFLHWNKPYQIHFLKLGYVTKIIEFSTTIPDNVDRNKIEPYDLKVRLFEFFDEVDTVFLKNPVAKIRFDDSIGDFEYDMDYSLEIKYKIDQMMQKTASAKKELLGLNLRSVEKKDNYLLNKGSGKNNVNKKGLFGNKVEEKGLIVDEDGEEVDNNLLPPLKSSYPQGRTVEEYDLASKTITRVIIVRGKVRNVYLKVKHNWGAVFYFKDEWPLTYRCITPKAYERETGFNETSH